MSWKGKSNFFLSRSVAPPSGEPRAARHFSRPSESGSVPSPPHAKSPSKRSAIGVLVHVAKVWARSERLLFQSAQGTRSRSRTRRNFGLAERGSLAAGPAGDARDRFGPDCDCLRCVYNPKGLCDAKCRLTQRNLQQQIPSRVCWPSELNRVDSLCLGNRESS